PGLHVDAGHALQRPGRDASPAHRGCDRRRDQGDRQFLAGRRQPASGIRARRAGRDVDAADRLLHRHRPDPRVPFLPGVSESYDALMALNAGEYGAMVRDMYETKYNAIDVMETAF